MMPAVCGAVDHRGWAVAVVLLDFPRDFAQWSRDWTVPMPKIQCSYFLIQRCVSAPQSACT